MQDETRLETLEDIKQLMNKSSRFTSLSGWSGVAAGICALLAAFDAADRIECLRRSDCLAIPMVGAPEGAFQNTLIEIALITFFVALTLFFTYLRSSKTGVGLWGYTARRVLVQLAVPMLVGGLFIWKLLQANLYGLVAPACLLFYGLALVNAGKYTLQEIRYLGYLQLLLGIVTLWVPGYGLYFWAASFGVLHILYGIFMWNKYERNQ